MTIHTRVVIVGGGIYGCGLLMQLVEKGWHDVTLIERSELTAGSTWHAAGFCTHYSFNPTHVFIRQFSTDLYRKLELEGEHPTGYHRCRGLRITHDADRIDEFRHGASVGRQLGIDFEVITPSEIREVFPMMDVGGLKGALFEPTDGYVDPAQTTNAMARIARQGGATIHRHCPAEKIKQLVSGEWQITTPDQVFIAEHVVLAPGFWANEVGKLIGLDLPITPMLHQYLVTEDHPTIKACEPDSIPLVRHHDYQWYSRRERDGMILGAYESEPQSWAVGGVPAGFGMELMPPEVDRVAHLMDDAMTRIPALGEAGIKTVVHGPISYSADGQPLIGPAPGLRNAWLACGSGFGIGEGAGAGRLLAEWMTEGQPPMHMGAFDPRRFGGYARGDYRIDTAAEIFTKQFATHYPFEEREAGRGSKISVIHDRLKAVGAQYGNVYGWERPNWFAASGETHQLSFRRTDWFNAVGRECRAVAQFAGVIDLSGFSKFEVRGPGAERLLDSLSANRLPRQIGEIRVCHFLNEGATIECEFTITRRGEHCFYLVCAALAELHHLDWLERHRSGFDCEIINLTENLGVLGLAGPGSQHLLATVCDQDIAYAQFPWLTAKAIEVAGIPLLAMRVSYTGEAGFELHLPAASLGDVYDALIQSTVGEHKPRNFGFYAMNSMRMEKAYRAWGGELSVENNPWELGLERFIVTEDRKFVGREGLLEAGKISPDRRLVCLEVAAVDAEMIGGEAVMSDDKLVGVAVSGAYGHRVGKSLGFALLEDDAIRNSQRLTVEMLGQHRTARLVVAPSYDPDSLLPRESDWAPVSADTV